MKNLSLFLMTLAALLLAGCGQTGQKISDGTSAENEGAVAVKNLRVENYFVKGENIQYFDKVPTRVVVNGETEIEAMMDLGLEDHVILATTNNARGFHMKPENAKRLQKVKILGRAYMNMEYIRSISPDLIVAEQDRFVQNQLRDTDYWNARGIRTYVPKNSNTPSKHIHPETLENEMEYIRGLGEIFNVRERAEAIERETYAMIDEINRLARDEAKPKVMFVEFLSAFISYDATKLAGDMARRIGAEVPVTPPVISFDHLIKENPDVLFVVCSHKDYGDCIRGITENPALQKLPCVKNKRVYSIPLRYTYATLVRAPDSLRYMAQCIYPELFEWKDIP